MFENLSRGGGKELRSAVVFSLYMFVFLLTELLVNARAAAALPRDLLEFAYAVSISSTGVGYLLYPLVRRAGVKSASCRRVMMPLFVAAAFVSLSAISFARASALGYLFLTVVCMASLGCVGGLVHLDMSVSFANADALARPSGAPSASR